MVDIDLGGKTFYIDGSKEDEGLLADFFTEAIKEKQAVDSELFDKDRFATKAKINKYQSQNNKAILEIRQGLNND